jgi:protein-S-isoprenylcysteine O-methyltransferase Ste14
MALIVAGLTIRWRAILTLKRQFTVDVSIRKDHRIVKTGIYRLIRHPAYAGSLLSFFGLGLFFTNYLSLIVIFLPICSAFLYRMTIEEKILVATFGEEYRDYYRTTKRLLPGVY